MKPTAAQLAASWLRTAAPYQPDTGPTLQA